MPRVTEEMLKEGLMVFHVHAFPDSKQGWVEPVIYRGLDTEVMKRTASPFGLFDVLGYQTFKDQAWTDWNRPWSRGCWRDNRSLLDMGIIPNNYNHHRTFTIWKEACEYIMQVAGIPQGSMTCPIEPYLVRVHQAYMGT